MPKSTTTRLYNLAQAKKQQRLSSNDPGTRSGSNKGPNQLLKEVGIKAKQKWKSQEPLKVKPYKMKTKKSRKK